VIKAEIEGLNFRVRSRESSTIRTDGFPFGGFFPHGALLLEYVNESNFAFINASLLLYLLLWRGKQQECPGKHNSIVGHFSIPLHSSGLIRLDQS
jgi:hypothetical protein